MWIFDYSIHHAFLQNATVLPLGNDSAVVMVDAMIKNLLRKDFFR